MRAGDKAIQLRWAMLTFAEIEIISAQSAVLRQNGQELDVYLQSDAAASDGSAVSWEIIDSATAINDWDSENTGSQMLGFTVNIAAHTTASFTVQLRQRAQEKCHIDNLDQWPEN